MREMNPRRALAAALLTALALHSASAGDVWVVRNNGVGSAKIGMTLAQLSAVLHEDLSRQTDKGENCTFVFQSQHSNIGLMIVGGKFVRTEIDQPGVYTAEGIQIGDTEERVKKVYGSRVKVEPHAYDGPEWHYLTVRSPNGRYGIRFETDGTKVVMFYAGTYKAIQYIEGCQ